jgi:arylsulfatase A-like enzyme
MNRRRVEPIMMRERRLRWPASSAIAVSFIACGFPSLAAEPPPNIVLIVADDLGWGDVGFNGRTEWSTPSLDRLARRGVILKRCYSVATVCAPSRAAFLTGRYTIHDGVRRNDEDLPTEETTIAEALKPRAYTTALFGKWHHGKPRQGRSEYVHPMDQGFDEFFDESRANPSVTRCAQHLAPNRGGAQRRMRLFARRSTQPEILEYRVSAWLHS